MVQSLTDFGAIVYKQDGSKKEIQLTKAVSIEDNDNAPEFFKSFFDQYVRNRHEYYKVPVADLQPRRCWNLIIDQQYTQCEKDTLLPVWPAIWTLSERMPIVKHKIIIETDNTSFVTARSINGAPEFQHSTNAEFNVYTWEDKDRKDWKM